MLHISNENTAYLFEISRYITNILKQGPKTCYVSIWHLLDSFMIGNILTEFEKIYRADFFQGNDLKFIYDNEI